MSSPVSLAGPGSQSTKARSSVAPDFGSRNRRKTALRGGGKPPAMAESAPPASGPETRTTAIAASPGAVESANIVTKPGFLARQRRFGPSSGLSIRRSTRPPSRTWRVSISSTSAWEV